MLGKIILWISTLAFVSYGIVCLYDPQTVAALAGLGIASGDGYVELGAMYGGLQTGFGVFCMLGALRNDLYRPALTLLVIVIGSLAVGRLYSTLTVADAVSGYTYGAMVYEFATAILAGVALKKA